MSSERLGRGPYGGNTMDLTILDGKITRVDDTWDYMGNGFSDEMWEPFAAWVVQEHPSDARVMYTDSTHTLARLTPKSLRLWEQRVAEYVATQP